VEEARKIYATACSAAQPSMPLVARAWSEAEWEMENPDTALSVLVVAYGHLTENERKDSIEQILGPTSFHVVDHQRLTTVKNVRSLICALIRSC
jgi:hypothetical protein